ncbi:MAG: glutamyl-tRNA reductase [Deltaproteobacteria bacterium]|nr:glutamyl-tRNA reductase [Deltaproteobacteria bacterium]
MIKIINIGMNHETAPVELRECLAAEAEGVAVALDAIRHIDCIREGLFISTCNRVEALVTAEDASEARKSIISLMSRMGNIPESEFSPNLYTHEDMDAVLHVFRVASSLDSLVTGEPQILGQIKEAYSQATKEKTAGVILNRLMHRAFHVAKRVRTETLICESAVSISYAAVELAKKIFHEIKGKKVLLIGAGEMAELAAKNLRAQGAGSISVANRTFDRAVRVAEIIDARPVSFEEIDLQLQEVDIVIASTASKEYIITCDQAKKSIRKRRNRPLFFIDIAVPRNIEPQINSLSNVYVYDIDDLKGVIKMNMAHRQQEAVKAERIVMEECIKFEKWIKTLAAVPTIISLKKKSESIIRAELKKSDGVLLKMTPEQKEAVQTLTKSVAEKILNDPILFLKGRSDRPSLDMYIDVTRRLFNLDREN